MIQMLHEKYSFCKLISDTAEKLQCILTKTAFLLK